MQTDRRTRMVCWSRADNSRPIVRPLTDDDSNDVREIERGRGRIRRWRSVDVEAREDEELRRNRGRRDAVGDGKPRDILDRGERVRVEPCRDVDNERNRRPTGRGNRDSAGRVGAAEGEVDPSGHGAVLNGHVRPTDRVARFAGKVFEPQLVDHRVELEGSRAGVQRGDVNPRPSRAVVGEGSVRRESQIGYGCGCLDAGGAMDLSDGHEVRDGQPHEHQQKSDGHDEGNFKPPFVGGEETDADHDPAAKAAAISSGAGISRAIGGSTSAPEKMSAAKWHSAMWPGATSTRGGAVVAQLSCANKHRVRKRHPLGRSIGLGSSPLIGTAVYSCAGSGTGTAERSARVEGWVGWAMTSSVGASSTIRPRYMTAIRSAMYRATAMSWVMNTYGI